MKQIQLTDSEIKSVVDLLLFKSIINDEPESISRIIRDFNLKPNHRILGLCEPMSYISKNFIEISEKKNYALRNKGKLSSISAISILEEQINKEFCTNGIHALELAIKIDALSVFHTLLDIGHIDYDTNSTHLCVRYLRPDMLLRLKEEGFDLWGENSDWGYRPIDTLLMMISFKEENPDVGADELLRKLSECFEIIIKSNSFEKVTESYNYFTSHKDGFSEQESDKYNSFYFSLVRKRKTLEELGDIFHNVIHGLI